MQNLALDCSLCLCFSCTGINYWNAEDDSFLKDPSSSCGTWEQLVFGFCPLLTPDSSPLGLSRIWGYFAPCFSCTLKRRGRKTGVRFFQDPGRVLTQVPLVTVQLPANYCTKDRRGSYSLHLLYSGLLTGFVFVIFNYFEAISHKVSLFTIPPMLCVLS